MFGRTEFRFCLLMRFCDNISVTELKKSPPDLCISDPIKKVTAVFLI